MPSRYLILSHVAIYSAIERLGCPAKKQYLHKLIYWMIVITPDSPSSYHNMIFLVSAIIEIQVDKTSLATGLGK